MRRGKKAQVFLLFGQSNAVGHAVPMAAEDRIVRPLENVFGLDRAENQTFADRPLVWSGYRSAGMNLGETQDDTYSVANCLARQWQDAVDAGCGLPDLYIVQIAVGAEGVTERFMWYPERPPRLVPGPLGTADVSLYPLAIRVLSRLDESLAVRGLEPELLLHWRGGEQEMEADRETLSRLKGIYERMLDGFRRAAGRRLPVVLHRFPYAECCMARDPSGGKLEKMEFINGVFAELAAERDDVSVFDPLSAPCLDPGAPGRGMFLEDLIHYRPEVNRWVASEILAGCRPV